MVSERAHPSSRRRKRGWVVDLATYLLESLFCPGLTSYAAPHAPGCLSVTDGGAAKSGRIEQLVNDNKVMLFMKGNKMFPQCGFSNTAIQVRPKRNG